MAIKYPKRTLKKNRNRDKLVTAACLLFARNGYQYTTLEEIAKEAGMHVQTLYGHFKNKEELAIAAASTVLEDCRNLFEQASPDQSTFEIWREWEIRTVSGLKLLGFGEHKREQLRSASSLMNDNFLLITYSGYEDLLTEYLAKDFHMDPQYDRLPRLAACLLWSGCETAAKRCAGLDHDGVESMDDDSIIQESVGVVDDVEKLFADYIKSSHDQIQKA